jgi:hypothetical protein
MIIIDLPRASAVLRGGDKPMTNHPNRSRTPYMVQTSPAMSMGFSARFSSYPHAMAYAEFLSRLTGYAEVMHKTGIVGQYEKGEPTEEFRDHHEARIATMASAKPFA